MYPAHDALAQDAARQQTKPLLLQRNQMPLADLGDRRNFFQRNAASDPLRPQVFSKVSHRLPNVGEGPHRFLLNDKPVFLP